MSVKDKYCTISPIYGIRKRETGEQNQRETVVGSGDEHVVPEGRGVGGGGKQARETEAQTSSHRTTGHRASCDVTHKNPVREKDVTAPILLMKYKEVK